MTETFSCSFRATELDAREGILRVVEQLKARGIPDLRVGEVQIALAEAVNNVVEHAYTGTAPGDVIVRCNLYPDHLWVNINDAGTPFPNGILPEGKMAEIGEDLDSLPEGGFGWFLIRELATDIHYQRDDDKNQLSMCFSLQLQAPDIRTS
jgi:serine/threonine-protein kinase RsbW